MTGDVTVSLRDGKVFLSIEDLDPVSLMRDEARALAEMILALLDETDDGRDGGGEG